MSFERFRGRLSDLRILELGHPLEMSIPVSPNHPGYKMALMRRHGDNVRADGGSASNEMILIGGHTGTHIDALAHVSQDGKLHGGVDAYAGQVGGRHKHHGMETTPPMLCRGVLLDIPALKHVDRLAPATRITADDIEAACKRQGIDPPGEGDAVLFRSGWAQHWGDAHTYLGHESGVPGPDVTAGAWLAERKVRVAAHDSMAFEWLGEGAGHSLLPVHGILLVQAGINIIENVNLEQLAAEKIHEFLFACLPLQFVGATGSPVRPVAAV